MEGYNGPEAVGRALWQFRVFIFVEGHGVWEVHGGYCL